MSRHDDGGEVQGGKTLRDEFAKDAMSAIMILTKAKMPIGPGQPKNNDMIANAAYAMADAMLRARKL